MIVRTTRYYFITHLRKLSSHSFGICLDLTDIVDKIRGECFFSGYGFCRYGVHVRPTSHAGEQCRIHLL